MTNYYISQERQNASVAFYYFFVGEKRLNQKTALNRTITVSFSFKEIRNVCQFKLFFLTKEKHWTKFCQIVLLGTKTLSFLIKERQNESVVLNYKTVLKTKNIEPNFAKLFLIWASNYFISKKSNFFLVEIQSFVWWLASTSSSLDFEVKMKKIPCLILFPFPFPVWLELTDFRFRIDPDELSFSLRRRVSDFGGPQLKLKFFNFKFTVCSFFCFKLRRFIIVFLCEIQSDKVDCVWRSFY